MNELSLKTGCFLVTKVEGFIDAGQIESIKIICSPEIEGKQIEEINIFVDDCSPDDTNGKKLKLMTNCCIPKIDFNDLNGIFQENNIVDNFHDFNCPNEVILHTKKKKMIKMLFLKLII